MNSIRGFYIDHESGRVKENPPRFGLAMQMIPESGATILDCGCNDGFLAKSLRKNGNTVIGMEINE
ncbi:hypothetical protein ACFLU0_00465, partial [Chloroflexota bacterium]